MTEEKTFEDLYEVIPEEVFQEFAFTHSKQIIFIRRVSHNVYAVLRQIDNTVEQIHVFESVNSDSNHLIKKAKEFLK